jgi:hypothetical protein
MANLVRVPKVPLEAVKASEYEVYTAKDGTKVTSFRAIRNHMGEQYEQLYEKFDRPDGRVEWYAVF